MTSEAKEFTRDPWLPEHIEAIAECLESGVTRADDIAIRIDRGPGVNTTENEVRSLFSQIKKKHRAENIANADMAPLLRAEANARRERNRKAVDSHEVIRSTTNVIPITTVAVVAPAADESAASVSTEGSGSITFVFDKDGGCREEIDPSKPVWLYLMRFVAPTVVVGMAAKWAKIGYSNNPVVRRNHFMCAFQGTITIESEVLVPSNLVSRGHIKAIEDEVHRRCPERIRGEIFKHVDVPVFEICCAQVISEYAAK